MAKKAKTKKAKPSGKNKTILSLTKSGLKKAGATPHILPQPTNITAASAKSAAHPSTHKEGSVIVAPGPNGTTIVCRFNPDTGNFDDCDIVKGKAGIQN